MKFEKFHNLFFDSLDGAFSRVTDREAYDSQITLTGEEYDIVTNYFGLHSIHVGNVASNRKNASKRFLLYNTGQYINLNLVYPKPNNLELRLYLARKNGFKPSGGMIWFIFKNKSNQLTIGALDEVFWNSLGQYDIDDPAYLEDIDNSIGNESSIDGITTELNLENVTIGKLNRSSKETFKRNPKLAIQRFQLSNFSCEIDSDHETFTSIKTGKPFVEAHHFIPMMYQGEYSFSLDQIENIICLCPNCHRGFHHAIPGEKIQYIEKVYEKRPSLSKVFPIAEINGLYNCYDI